jgi:alpha amylase catalytic region
MKRIIILTAGLLALAATGNAEPGRIDNSALLPRIIPDPEVRLESLSPGATASPDWVKSLIIVEVNPSTASPDRKLADMTAVLDHLAETGVNGVWITPIQECRTYGGFGLHTVDPRLTGEKEIPKRWARVREFVEQAHRRNIRVFFDVISWGVTYRNNGGAPLYKQKPEWFGPAIKQWNGWSWNWDNAELREWYASRLVDMILMTGADGFRCDCAPAYAGYEPFRIARQRLLNFGRKVIFISERASSRKGVFDFDQLAFQKNNDRSPRARRWVGEAFLEGNIVDMIKNGDELVARDSDVEPGGFRYYAYQLTCHDSPRFISNGSPIVFGYQALFSPFIPLWFLGEEWNNPRTVKPKAWSYINPVDWKARDQAPNRDFFELVKRMIRIRRSYPEIFEYFPARVKDSNICKVETDQKGRLQAYARYRNGQAVLIVPNDGKTAEKFHISIPRRAAGITSSSVTVRDLLNERRLFSGKPATFEAEIPAGMLGVYLVEPAK